MPEVVAAALWRVTDELLLALDERFGEPVDAYLNGAQVWLRDDGPGGEVLEWRLHPVASFRRPADVDAHELLATVVYALRTDSAPPGPIDTLWEGLEAFPAYGDELEPAPLVAACTAVLGVAPDAYGVVDHDRVGDEWERSSGRTSIVAGLRAQLDGGAAGPST
jgi:hypothetical protein